MRTRTNKPDPVSHTIQHKSRAANQAPLSKILQAYKERSALNATVQREAMEEDDELLQGKFETAQREALPEEDEEPFQQKTENKTGLPDDLKAGVEAVSGYNMDDVRVHYNSSKPAQLQALAYTQGTEIHVGPGQEKHLPHEAWHVVQQKQGRVQPTVQMQGVQVNDDEGLEREADVVSNKLVKYYNNNISTLQMFQNKKFSSGNILLQAMFGRRTLEPMPQKLEYERAAMATTCSMVLYRYDLTKIEERYFVSGGHHAEEKVILYLTQLVNNRTLVPQGQLGEKDYTVYLAISKSPCSSTSHPATRTDGQPGCLERLNDLRQNGIANPAGGVNITFNVLLAATKPYSPKVVGGKDASRDTYGRFGGGGSGGSFPFIKA